MEDRTCTRVRAAACIRSCCSALQASNLHFGRRQAAKGLPLQFSGRRAILRIPLVRQHRQRAATSRAFVKDARATPRTHDLTPQPDIQTGSKLFPIDGRLCNQFPACPLESMPLPALQVAQCRESSACTLHVEPMSHAGLHMPNRSDQCPTRRIHWVRGSRPIARPLPQVHEVRVASTEAL